VFKHHAMKECGGKPPCIFNLGTR